MTAMTICLVVFYPLVARGARLIVDDAFGPTWRWKWPVAVMWPIASVVMLVMLAAIGMTGERR